MDIVIFYLEKNIYFSIIRSNKNVKIKKYKQINMFVLFYNCIQTFVLIEQQQCL